MGEMELKGKWAMIITNTGLPLLGKSVTIKAYCGQWNYIITQVLYDGDDYCKAEDAFNTTQGSLFSVGL